MSRLVRILCPALCLGFSLSAATAFATDPAAEMRERIEKLKKLHEEQRKQPMEAQLATQEEQIARYEDLVFKGNYQQQTYLKLSRDYLQRMRREYVAQKWGRTLDNAEATKELREHGQRVAELKRVQMLGRGRNLPVVVVKAKDLLQAENARHEAHMQQLASEAGVQVATQKAGQ